MKAPKATWLITYENADVTDELAPLITSVEYVDHVKDKSDELTLTVANDDLRWLKGWYPSEGDRIDVKIGYEGQPLLPCGRFQVDEVDMSGTADQVSIRALAAAVGKPVRTKESRAFESISLRELADLLARELELELVGDVADVQLLRVTQKEETTLAFLRRLAADYGYAFSIRDTKLTFFEIAKLEATPPVLTMSRRDLPPGYRFKAKTQGTYVACEVTFLDPQTKQPRTVRVEQEKARERVIIAGQASGGATGVELPPLIPTRLLLSGVTGDDVRAWQEFLRGQGHDPGPIDGIFGPRTRAATISFQRAAGARQDGIAGPETFRAAVSRGFDMRTSSSSGSGTRAEIAGNVLRRNIRVESLAQAELKARALLAEANRLKASGSLPLIGNTRVLAGATIELTDMGRLSGRYLVQDSRHRMDRSGSYSTEAEVTFVS